MNLNFWYKTIKKINVTEVEMIRPIAHMRKVALIHNNKSEKYKNNAFCYSQSNKDVTL